MLKEATFTQWKLEPVLRGPTVPPRTLQSRLVPNSFILVNYYVNRRRFDSLLFFFQAERFDLLHPLTSVATEWQACRDQLNLPREATQSVLLNDTLYISHPDRPVLYKYSISMKSWYPIPTEVSNYALATYCSEVVLIGGVKDEVFPKKCVTVQDGTNNSLEYKLNSAITDPDEYRFKNARAASDGEYLIVIDDGTTNTVLQFDNSPLKIVRVFNGKMWTRTNFITEGNRPHHMVINDGQVYVFIKPYYLYKAPLDSFTKSPLELKWEMLKVPTLSLTNVGDQWVAVEINGGMLEIHVYPMTCQKLIDVEDTEVPFGSITSIIGVPVSEHQPKQLELCVVGRTQKYGERDKVNVAKIVFSCKLIV